MSQLHAAAGAVVLGTSAAFALVAFGAATLDRAPWWLDRIRLALTGLAHTYEVRDLDVDARNAETLAALREEPWEGVWRHAAVARAYMLVRAASSERSRGSMGTEGWSGTLG